MPSTLRGSIRTNSFLHRPWLSVVFGSAVVSLWTLLRFFNQGPNFDQVGQQVLAHQWLHGLHTGSVIGPTNYIFKMLILYMPMDSINLPAQLKLIAMTLLINLVTFLLIVYVLQKIWEEFYPAVKSSFYTALIYLSLIAGSVFWISFTNSRNLEVVGGLYLIYLCIRAYTHPSRLYYGLIVAIGAVLFFSDPLQIYMSLLPVQIFIFLRLLRSRDQRQLITFLKILGCSLVAILLSRLLARVASTTWNIAFTSTSQSPKLSVPSIKLAIEQMARLYAGGYEAGRIREVLDLFVALGSLVGAIYVYLRQLKARGLISLIATIWAVDLAVYIISGQSLQSGTNRYLVMTVPFFVLLLAIILYYLPKKKLFLYSVGAILLFNFVTLVSAFNHAWNPHFTNNNHERSAINYLDQHHYKYGYGSIGTALASDYLSNQKVKFLPLGCEPNQTLKKTTLFFDKASFEVSKQQSSGGLVPVVLDGNIIKINQAACAPDQIRIQLGRESSIDHLSDGSTVMLYKAYQLDNLPG